MTAAYRGFIPMGSRRILGPRETMWTLATGLSPERACADRPFHELARLEYRDTEALWLRAEFERASRAAKKADGPGFFRHLAQGLGRLQRRLGRDGIRLFRRNPEAEEDSHPS
jgi:hypothetical protein